MRNPLALACAIVAMMAGLPTVWAQQPQKYNVLFIMSDDLRVELGCYGSRLGAVTPNIDALAKSGVRFERAYCQYPLCNPSRSSMLTGRHPVTTGVLGNGGNVRQSHPDWVNLPQLFKNNGYSTLRAGKNFHGGQDDAGAWTEGGGGADGRGGAGGRNMVIPPQQAPPQPGDVPAALAGDIAQRENSDRIVILDGNGEGNPDHGHADRVIGYLNQYKDKPFYIGLGFAKPQSAPAAPQKYFDLYDVNKIQLPPDFGPWPFVPKGFPAAAIRMRNADLFIGRGATEYEAKEVTRAYLASTSWMDWNVGRVIAELDKLGLREKTIIVFWGDHGYQLGEKGKWSKAGSLFEYGTRVPLIVAAPGAKGNGTPSPRVVQSIDIYATLADLCGLKTEEGIEGKSLAMLLADPKASWDRPAYSVWSEDGRTLHGVAVRNEKMRYAEFGPNGQNGAMLLDPENDPYETKNLIDDPQYAAIRAEMAKLAKEYAGKLGR